MTRRLSLLLGAILVAASIAAYAKASGTLTLDNPAGLKFGDTASFTATVNDLRDGTQARVALECDVFALVKGSQITIDLGEQTLPGEGTHAVSFLLQNTDSNQLYHPATCRSTLHTGDNANNGNTLDIETFVLEPIPYTDPVWPQP